MSTTPPGTGTGTEVDAGRVRAAWAAYQRLGEELLELALATGDVDEASAAALLRRLVGHQAFSTLQLAGDPARPQLIDAQYAPWNWGHSNPDTLYLSAVVDEWHGYRVSGRLGTAAQTTFGMYAGMADQSAAVKVLADELEVGESGSFELVFSRERPDGVRDWRPMPDGAASFASYQTFSDWQTQRPGTMRIECLDAVPAASPASPAETVAAFERHLEASRELFTMWVRDIPQRVFGRIPRNHAIAPVQPPSAMAGAWFVPVPWRLEEGQALVVEYAVPTDAPYLGLCLTDRWSSMIDVETRQTSLNLAQSQVVDGRVRVLVATEDHGVHNWLDARGSREGVLTWRVSRDEAPERPVVTVIRADEVDAHFGPETRVTPDQRAAAMAARLAHVASRR